jgi:predicted hydrocarbon binding protein
MADINANRILSDLMYDPAAGRLSFKDVRYLLIRPDTLVEFQKAVEAEVGWERCGAMMMAGGITGGARSAARYKSEFGLTDAQVADFMCTMGREIGWGHFTLIELSDAPQGLVVEVLDSPFAAAYGDSDHGVCHLIRGVLAGLASGIFASTVRSAETACRARGDAVCRFEIQPD